MLLKVIKSKFIIIKLKELNIFFEQILLINNNFSKFYKIVEFILFLLNI